MREEFLIEQLINLMDTIDINELGMKHKFEEEMKRLQRFQRGVLGMTQIPKSQEDISMRTYAKYLLREGSIVEKRELLGCMKSKLVLKEKTVATIQPENVG